MTANDVAREILSKNRFCQLSTATLQGKTELSNIQFAARGFTLYFKTFYTYRKFDNLMENPQGSILVNLLPHSLQMDGTIDNLINGRNAKRLLIEKLGPRYNRAFFKDQRVRYFRFTPTWGQVLMNSEYPPKFEELML